MANEGNLGDKPRDRLPVFPQPVPLPYHALVQ
jgi:hypothetical protein